MTCTLTRDMIRDMFRKITGREMEYMRFEDLVRKIAQVESDASLARELAKQAIEMSARAYWVKGKADDEETQASAVGEWHSVDESLPEGGQCVIVLAYRRDPWLAIYQGPGWRSFPGWNLLNGVTHWAEIHDVPEEREVIDWSKITRVEVISRDDGRKLVAYGKAYRPSVQDHGQTLKLFMEGD